jgi:hypothetical protein
MAPHSGAMPRPTQHRTSSQRSTPRQPSRPCHEHPEKHHQTARPPPQRRRAAPLAPAQTRGSAGRRLAKSAASTIRPRAAVSFFENLGDDPVFSDFAVFNPDSGRRYRVAIRGAQPATTIAPVPTSRPTIWAPASTSNSRSPRSAPGGRQAAHSSGGFQRIVQRAVPRLCRPATRPPASRQRFSR